MYIKATYKFEKDGVKGLACGYKPTEGEILEVYQILYAEPGYELYKGDEVVGAAIALAEGESKADYTEKEIVAESEEDKE